MKAKTPLNINVWKMPNIPDQKEMQKYTTPLLERAAGFQIKSQDHFLASGLIVQDLDRAMSRVDDLFGPFVNGLHKRHKMAKGLYDGFYNPLFAAKKRLHALRTAWSEEQEELKRRAEAKLAEGLRKEQQRDLEKQARAAEKSGEAEVAAALREQAQSVPLPVMKSEPAVPQQQGFIHRQRWVFEILDADAVPRQYCSPDEKKIRKVVEGIGNAAAIPGVRIWQESSEYSRTVNE